ncbi:MAG: IS3 family transposase [Ferrimicrobium acidiphilum]
MIPRNLPSVSFVGIGCRTSGPLGCDGSLCLSEITLEWYNRKRRHSSINYLSPIQFEQTATP